MPPRSAAQKLGVRPASSLGLIGADAGWALDGLPEDVEVRRDRHGDVTVGFVRSRHQLMEAAERWVTALEDSASLWVAWPRRAAGHASDVSENLLREVFLARGLVDVKVAPIDEDWSGLKFVRRKQRRSSSPS